MHTMKKQVLVILSVSAAIFIWSGCSGDKDTSSEEAIAAEVENEAAAKHVETEADRMAREGKAKAEELARNAKADAIKAAEEIENK